MEQDILSIQNICDQVDVLFEETKKELRKASKYGNGFYAKISKIWRENFLTTETFTDYHEVALIDFIFVECYGWNINDRKFWHFNEELQTRINFLSYKNKLAGSLVRRVVSDLKSKINNGLVGDGDGRKKKKV